MGIYPRMGTTLKVLSYLIQHSTVPGGFWEVTSHLKLNCFIKMLNKVSITIVEGEYKGKEISFDSRTTCIIGRSYDCNLVIPD